MVSSFYSISYLSAFAVGFATSLGLILAIGAQNAFVLRCGLRHMHVFWVCLFCAVSDAMLITAGITGLGWLTKSLPWLETTSLGLGITFLVIYGTLRIRAFFKPSNAVQCEKIPSLAQTLLVCAAFTWLNPMVYVDTVFLIGAISIPYSDLSQKVVFGAGATLASFSFFFALGYSARALSKLFNNPLRWRYVELGIGIVMYLIAAQLAWYSLAMV